MHEFKSFVYLDVQKTGSTFVSSMLENHFRGMEVKKRRHVGMRKNYAKRKFCFISVRDPLDQYASLYSYGCLTKGKVFRLLNEAGKGHLYDRTWTGFRAWLNLVLRPEKAEYLDARYAAGGGRLCELVGFQSYRVLQLALPDAENLLRQCKEQEEIRHLFRTRKRHQFTVRYESLRADLARLLRTKLYQHVNDLEAALAFVEKAGAVNSSDRVDRYEKDPTLGKQLENRLRTREWLLYEEFGYGAPPCGINAPSSDRKMAVGFPHPG